MRKVSWARAIRKFFKEKDARERAKLKAAKGKKVSVPLETFLCFEDRSGVISNADLKLMNEVAGKVVFKRIRKPVKGLLYISDGQVPPRFPMQVAKFK